MMDEVIKGACSLDDGAIALLRERIAILEAERDRERKWEQEQRERYDNAVTLLTAENVQLKDERNKLSGQIDDLSVSPEAIAESLDHGRNCAAWLSETGHEVNGEDCTCGYRYRIQLQTEQNIRAAWMKRAMEAEAERDDLLRKVERMGANVSDEEWSRSDIEEGEQFMQRYRVDALIAARASAPRTGGEEK